MPIINFEKNNETKWLIRKQDRNYNDHWEAKNEMIMIEMIQ
jgi:hypothetical protein